MSNPFVRCEWQVRNTIKGVALGNGRPATHLVNSKYLIHTLANPIIKESLNNVSIPSNRTLNFKNSALDFQDKAGFA
jgi:hypothetical protein